jgi:large subunit ribosomal protein L14e
MIEVGRLCVKTAGRDAGGKCVIVDVLDNNFVTIDGNVRRRKCNVAHLEPLKDVIKISKGASHETVKKEFDKLKIPVWETKSKPKTEKPKRVRGKKKKAEEKKETKGKKKAPAKKTAKKAAEKKPKETESVEDLVGGSEEKEAKN